MGSRDWAKSYTASAFICLGAATLFNIGCELPGQVKNLVSMSLLTLLHWTVFSPFLLQHYNNQKGNRHQCAEYPSLSECSRGPLVQVSVEHTAWCCQQFLSERPPRPWDTVSLQYGPGVAGNLAVRWSRWIWGMVFLLLVDMYLGVIISLVPAPLLVLPD